MTANTPYITPAQAKEFVESPACRALEVLAEIVRRAKRMELSRAIGRDDAIILENSPEFFLADQLLCMIETLKAEAEGRLYVEDKTGVQGTVLRGIYGQKAGRFAPFNADTHVSPDAPLYKSGGSQDTEKGLHLSDVSLTSATSQLKMTAEALTPKSLARLIGLFFQAFDQEKLEIFRADPFNQFHIRSMETVKGQRVIEHDGERNLPEIKDLMATVADARFDWLPQSGKLPPLLEGGKPDLGSFSKKRRASRGNKAQAAR